MQRAWGGNKFSALGVSKEAKWETGSRGLLTLGVVLNSLLSDGEVLWRVVSREMTASDLHLGPRSEAELRVWDQGSARGRSGAAVLAGR